MGANPLSGIRAKIERSKIHINELEREIASFKDTRPYLLIIYQDPHAGEQGVRVNIVHPIPYHWACIIGDAIHNLRSSLDLLAYALVRYAGKNPMKNTYFPISGDKETFESSGLEKVKGASNEAIALLNGLQPYKCGGGHVLWQLHQLDILDKHILLVPVGAAFAGIRRRLEFEPADGNLAPTLTDWESMAMDRVFPLEDGMTLVREPLGTGLGIRANAHYEFNLQIAFGVGQIVDGQPVVATLKKMTQSVESAVATFAKEIFRIT